MCIWFTTQVHSSQQCLLGAHRGPVITVLLQKILCCCISQPGVCAASAWCLSDSAPKMCCCMRSPAHLQVQRPHPASHSRRAYTNSLRQKKNKASKQVLCSAWPHAWTGLLRWHCSAAFNVVRVPISALTLQHFVGRSGVQPGGSAAALVEEAGAAAQGLPCACCARMGALHPQPQPAALVHTNSGH
jgi:hypothetical protein